MKYGHFDDKAREYVIETPRTPYPWINYLGCEQFFGIISNTAGGYCFYRDARLRRVTRYRYNNMPVDNGGRYFYINDNGTVWNPGWKPVKTELDAKGGKVTTNAGKARTDSADPTFATAKIAPYELNVTAYVDRGIARLSPAAYFEKVYGMALRAMRRKTCECIISGDGQASPDMFGIANAKNTDGENIFASIASLPMDASILDELFFAYGGDTVLGMGARVILTKSQLKALGTLRNSNMERVFKIRPDAGNPNTGMIDDGGTMHPYTLVSGDGTKIMYGDPMNYELALFGGFTVRVDESIKGVERMFTILGDAMIGGNLIADKGMVVGTIAQG